MSFYAHTAALADGSRDPDEGHWQPLAAQLRNVAELAEKFGAPLGMGAEAKLTERHFD